jgi:hypothetical protein
MLLCQSSSFFFVAGRRCSRNCQLRRTPHAPRMRVSKTALYNFSDSNQALALGLRYGRQKSPIGRPGSVYRFFLLSHVTTKPLAHRVLGHRAKWISSKALMTYHQTKPHYTRPQVGDLLSFFSNECPHRCFRVYDACIAVGDWVRRYF